MEITLDSEWRIESDQYSYALIKEGKTKTGKKGRRYAEYYPDLTRCLKSYLNHRMKESGSIEEVLKRIKEVEVLIESFSLRIVVLERTGRIIL